MFFGGGMVRLDDVLKTGNQVIVAGDQRQKCRPPNSPNADLGRRQRSEIGSQACPWLPKSNSRSQKSKTVKNSQITSS